MLVAWLTAVVSGGASRPQWRHSSGAGAPVGLGKCAGLVIVNAASSPPAAHIAAGKRAVITAVVSLAVLRARFPFIMREEWPPQRKAVPVAPCRAPGPIL